MQETLPWYAFLFPANQCSHLWKCVFGLYILQQELFSIYKEENSLKCLEPETILHIFANSFFSENQI